MCAVCALFVVSFNLISFLFIFIFLSRESDRGVTHRTNPDLLRSCLCFRVFQLSFASDSFDLQLVSFHQAKIIIIKAYLSIEGCDSEAWVGVEPLNL